MKRTLTATLIAALATPSFAGGPVLPVEEPEVIAEKPSSRINPIIPILLLVAVGILVGQSTDDPVDGSSSSS